MKKIVKFQMTNLLILFIISIILAMLLNIPESIQNILKVRSY